MLNQLIVQTYGNYTDYVVNNQITFNSWLNLIKTGDHDYINNILSARKAGKGSEDYEEQKSIVPVANHNFIFGKERKNKYLLRPTGLLYLDIDKPSFDINSLNKELIHAYWKSFGGNGYSIIVKVEGLTEDNFNDTYQYIVEKLGVEEVYDVNAKKANQANVLSYDPNLYFNKDSYVFSSINKNGKKDTNSITKKKQEGFTPNETFFPGDSENIRFNNIEEYFTGEYKNKKYRVLEDDEQMIAVIYIPWYSKVGNRNRNMYNFGCQTMGLNPGLKRSRFIGLMNYANSKLNRPLSGKEIESIIRSVWKKYLAGKITLYRNKKRRILFNPEFNLSGDERRKLTNKVLGKIKSDKTRQSIYDCIEDWNFGKDGKITQSSLEGKTDRKIATIKRYWPDFKSYIWDLNAENGMLCDKTIKKLNKAKEKDVIDLNEEVEIKTFFIDLFERCNQDLDVKFIVNFQLEINSSTATIANIIRKLIEILKENKYKYSKYEHIDIPEGIVHELKEGELRMVA